MTILNRPSDGLLTVLLALHKALAILGPMPENRLKALTGPPSAIGESKMIALTLNRWKQIGLFIEEAGALKLANPFSAIPPDDLKALRGALLGLALTPESNPWISEESEAMTSDWTQAASWVLCQDPYSFPSRYEEIEALQDAQGVNVFTNDTRWGGFVEWSTFLGIAWSWRSRAGTVFDPTFALEVVLPRVLRSGDQLPIKEFIDKTSAVLPIIDTGVYATALQARIRTPWHLFEPEHILPCLSAALERLEMAGLIRMDILSDAPMMSLLGREGRVRRQVTHVAGMAVN
jgi:hypothetical protein